MYSIEQLKTFINVANLQSFTLAARDLFVTTTAVSKQIKQLEDQIQEKLFIRSTRRVMLTEFGESFYIECKKLIRKSNELNEFIESRKTIPTGKLTVLVSTILSKDFVLNHLNEFCELYPRIDCEFIFSEHDQDTGQENIDIMVGFPQIPPYTDSLHYRLMYKVSNILCASPKLIMEYGPIDNVSDLMRCPFISHSLRKPATKLTLKNGERIFCPEPKLFMNNFHALNTACINGLGVFLTADKLVEKQIKDGELIHILPNLEFRAFEIFMFYRVYKQHSNKTLAFLNFYQSKLIECL